MATGTISPVAVLRDARILRQALKSALLRTRLMDDIDMIHTMETLYYGPLDTRYAAIAIMSASSSLSTTAFISGVQVPVRVPILMSLSWR